MQTDECAAFFAGHFLFCTCAFGGQSVFGSADGAGFVGYIGRIAVSQMVFDDFATLVVVHQWCQIVDLLRKYPEDLQFPNEIPKPHQKKRQGIQTAHR